MPNAATAGGLRYKRRFGSSRMLHEERFRRPSGWERGTVRGEDLVVTHFMAVEGPACGTARHAVAARFLAAASLVILVGCSSPEVDPGGSPSRRAPAASQEASRPERGAATATAADPFESALRVGGDVKAPSIVERADPKTLPPGAKCRGLVMMELIVDESGAVVAARDLTPKPDLFTAAWVESTRQSRFRPATRDGVPVRVRFSYLVHLRCAGPSAVERLAGDGAVDCGIGRSVESDAGVRRCVDEQRRLGRACHFVIAASEIDDERAPLGPTSFPGDPVLLAHVVSADGTLLHVWKRDGKDPEIRPGAIRIEQAGARLGHAFRPPVPVGAPSRPAPGVRDQRLLVETIVRRDGSVAAARAIRAPAAFAHQAESLVSATRFKAALLMGVPFEIVWNVAIDVRDGTATLQTPPVVP